MATVWDGAESANQELGAGKRGNTESGKQNKGLSIIVTLADGGGDHLHQAVGEYISIEHQIQWKMNRLQGCNFDGL